MGLPIVATFGICALVIAGIVGRPFRWPEAIWAVLGAVALPVFGLVPPGAALRAIGRGADVYLFLTGMMLLSETARQERVFDWLAATATHAAGGSTARLFALVYAAGIVTTVFLSNDATAVVLTPAVYAAAKQAKADPLPLLFACALVANAASFVLPISNPANLVLYGGAMPALGRWLAAFALPSGAAIAVTYGALRWVERRRLRGRCEVAAMRAAMTGGGMAALGGIAATATLLIAMSAYDQPLGLPTCLAGIATLLVVAWMRRRAPFAVLRGVSWGILPLVAGLFVLVAGVERTGVTADLADALRRAAMTDPVRAAAIAGAMLAFVSNLANNLPAGLVASAVVAQAAPPRVVVDSMLIGVDLGPNLSITGSLATILWLQAVRREGEEVGYWRFLRVGVVVMPLALGAALAASLI